MVDVFDRLAEAGVVPVIAIESRELALPLADALLAGGVAVAEITFRTEAAADVIAMVKAKRPELLVGAGTVLTVDQARRAKECGAEFAVSPGLNGTVVREAVRLGLPMAPGVMTPSDIEAAVELGLKVLKFFPAGTAGGVKGLKSIGGPYRHLGLRFMPTGGVTAGNLPEYLSEPMVLAAGGTWLATTAMIEGKQWDAITGNCRDAAALVATVRKAE